MIHEIVVVIIAVKLKEEFRMACEHKTLLGPVLSLYDPRRDVGVGYSQAQKPMVLSFLSILLVRMWRDSSLKKGAFTCPLVGKPIHLCDSSHGYSLVQELNEFWLK